MTDPNSDTRNAGGLWRTKAANALQTVFPSEKGGVVDNGWVLKFYRALLIQGDSKTEEIIALDRTAVYIIPPFPIVHSCWAPPIRGPIMRIPLHRIASTNASGENSFAILSCKFILSSELIPVCNRE